MPKKFFYGTPVIILSLLVKLNLTGLPGFYMGNLGNHQEKLSPELIFKMSCILLMDVAFYAILFLTKDRYLRNNYFEATNLNLSKKISPETILYSISKYCFVCVFILMIWTGELEFLIKFIINHPSSVMKLLKISWLYFLHQYAIYYCLIQYDAHVFFSIMSTIGLYGRI